MLKNILMLDRRGGASEPRRKILRSGVMAAFALFTTATATHAGAALEWKTTTLTVEVPANKERVEVSIPFVNPSDRTEAPQLGELPAGVEVIDAPQTAAGQQGELKLAFAVG